ncbi:MAG: rhodanese-like domain-containing protein [Candidatus Neomarinimicrobiota bacterium]
MKHIVHITQSLLVALVLIPQVVIARGPLLEGALVSTEWLAGQLDDPDLVLLHVGSPDEYAEVHLPGARLISPQALMTQSPEGIDHEMSSVADLDSAFEAVGVSDNSTVVIYSAVERGAYMAARVYLTLDYLGMGDRIALLDGGLPQWVAEERPVTGEVTEFEPGVLEPQVNHDVIVSADWLVEHLRDPEVVIVDARPVKSYEGHKAGGGKRPGHIAGAHSLVFTTMVLDDQPNKFKSERELHQLFSDASASKGSQIVIYCGTGIWACQVYMAARHLGYDVRLFDGGYQEWTADESRPIVAPVKTSLLKKIFKKR